MTLYEKYQQDRSLVLDLLGEMADYAGFYVVGSGVMPTIAYNITISASEKERLKNGEYIEPKEPQKDSLINPTESEKKVKNAIFVIRNLINSLYTNLDEVGRLSALSQLHRLLHNVIFPKIEDIQDSPEKTLHERNMEVVRLNHEQSMELEVLRNRRAFDSIAMADLEAILASEDTEGVIITKRLSAIAWCHQQAALLHPNVSFSTNGGGINIESVADSLFKTFFPDLSK